MNENCMKRFYLALQQLGRILRKGSAFPNPCIPIDPRGAPMIKIHILLESGKSSNKKKQKKGGGGCLMGF